MLNVLITGSDGFVGKQFIKVLSNTASIRTVDVKSGLDCREFFKVVDTSFDLVIHLAAIVGGRESIEGRPLAVADNLSIDSEFFQWCLKTKPKKVVYFSSSAAYPTYLQTHELSKKLTESDINLNNIATPDLTYGWSKLVGEYLASFLDNVYVFRPFSGYGTDQDLTYPFPKYIQRALNKENPFEIWGDGNQCRDFIHITDIVNAVLTAVKEDVKGPINLGWGRETSFNELAKLVSAEQGYFPKIKYLGDKPTGCVYRVSDNTKMLSFYSPKITLEQGIAEALRG